MKEANLSSRYEPVAVYYEDSDSVEYVMRDVPSLHRRVDNFLTLVLDLETRELIGFRLKGFNGNLLKPDGNC